MLSLPHAARQCMLLSEGVPAALQLLCKLVTRCLGATTDLFHPLNINSGIAAYKSCCILHQLRHSAVAVLKSNNNAQLNPTSLCQEQASPCQLRINCLPLELLYCTCYAMHCFKASLLMQFDDILAADAV